MSTHEHTHAQELQVDGCVQSRFSLLCFLSEIRINANSSVGAQPSPVTASVAAILTWTRQWFSHGYMQFSAFVLRRQLRPFITGDKFDVMSKEQNISVPFRLITKESNIQWKWSDEFSFCCSKRPQKKLTSVSETMSRCEKWRIQFLKTRCLKHSIDVTQQQRRLIQQHWPSVFGAM